MVNGVPGVGYLGAPIFELIAKSYRPRSDGQDRLGQLGQLSSELGRRTDPGPPNPFAERRVTGCEGLAAPGVEHSETTPARAALLGQPRRQGVKGADPGDGQPEARAEPAGAGDPDPQPGEGAGPDPDRDPVDLLPPPGSRDRPLDLSQQAGRVARAAVRREAQQRLVEDLAVRSRADGRVLGGGVEADQCQISAGS
jgi:hypothetical protein